MCGVIGFVGQEAAAHINLGLSFLQHRGQDAAGIVTLSGTRVFMDKGYGTADDVFNEQRLAGLIGDIGIGHVRYSTVGDARASSEMQPFYVNQPCGMALVHNGNLTNCAALRQQMASVAYRHISSDSDSEVLLNVLADAIANSANGRPLSADLLFEAVAVVHQRCAGSYSAVVVIAGLGLLAFRDPHGIRPLIVAGDGHGRWLVASENIVCRPLQLGQAEDIAPGEAIFIDQNQQLCRRQCAPQRIQRPCIFEYIYLARPDSTLEGASVYEARLNMGRKLAERIRRDYQELEIDCVIPVPDSGRIAAMELAHVLNIPYREGLVKNRYVGRTFIMAGQLARQSSVRKKLNVIDAEFAGKNVLLVDDSIVRGTTGRELVALARASGAKRVYFASAAPPVRHPNVYGIDIPTRTELLAVRRDEAEIAAYLGADQVIFQSLPDLIAAVQEVNSALTTFETSCFDGDYQVGEVSDIYLAELERARQADRPGHLAQGNLLLRNI